MIVVLLPRVFSKNYLIFVYPFAQYRCHGHLYNGQVVFLRPSEEGLADQIMRAGDLREGTRYQFELSCLNSPIPFVEALIVKTPFDLVVDGVVTDEDLAKRGILDLQRKEVRISRLRIQKNGELILSSSNTKVIFESGVFESGGKLKNFNGKYLVYDVAEEKKLLGKSGASIDLFGIEASGSVTLDLRGYPGERGDPGVDWSADELLPPAKNGRDAQFSFAGWPRETKQQCAVRRDPSDRPSPRGDRFSALRGCNIMFVSCVSEATDGESVRGLTGRPGGVGKQGGSLNPSMVGPRGEVEDVLVWEGSAKTYRPIRPTFLSR
ncbi:MAG: hypothetical protein LW875_06880 [Proteobacteria bacterium]|jgi:hypothetical protein|nr:hypothetical protein [Pseudomonadota bacterium]